MAKYCRAVPGSFKVARAAGFRYDTRPPLRGIGHSAKTPSTPNAKVVSKVECVALLHTAKRHCNAMTDSEFPSTDDAIHEDRLWRDDGWTARVIKNEDDDGWAVEMIQAGEAEPALVGPWTMGRDKKNPKPLDSAAFRTLVKTASEVLRRHEQQRHAMLHKNVTIDVGGEDITVALEIVPDEDDPYANLKAFDSLGAQLAHVRVSPAFKLTKASAERWAENGFEKPN
ncbi:hypothetical protein GCM10010985_55110 [Caballeronia grimmiae]|uniref:Uncharacterized protein n=2 Tax=Caballeronia grimmiae TaxID=1071679 RepID=A0ABQ1S6T3_9BURK|nr:hypothetical protein GCM10010985_55110 [Caballeronia grimmiae]